VSNDDVKRPLRAAVSDSGRQPGSHIEGSFQLLAADGYLNFWLRVAVISGFCCCCRHTVEFLFHCREMEQQGRQQDEDQRQGGDNEFDDAAEAAWFEFRGGTLKRVREDDPAFKRFDQSFEGMNMTLFRWREIVRALEMNSHLENFCLDKFFPPVDASPEACTNTFKRFVKALRNIPTLTRVKMEDICLSDESAKIIAEELIRGNNTLQRLSLLGNEIGANGARDIAADLPGSSLTFLDFGWNPVGDDGAVALAKLVTEGARPGPKALLRILLVNGCGITCVGAAALASALKQNTTLQDILLIDNDFPSEDAEPLLLEALKHCNYTMTGGFCHGEDSVMVRRALDENREITKIFHRLVPPQQQGGDEDLCIETAGEGEEGAEHVEPQVGRSPTIPDSLWPAVLGCISQKPDVLFAVIKHFDALQVRPSAGGVLSLSRPEGSAPPDVASAGAEETPQGESAGADAGSAAAASSDPEDDVACTRRLNRIRLN